MSAAGVTNLIEEEPMIEPYIVFPDGGIIPAGRGIMFRIKRLELAIDNLIGALRGH